MMFVNSDKCIQICIVLLIYNIENHNSVNCQIINMEGIGATFPDLLYIELQLEFVELRKDFVNISMEYTRCDSGAGKLK